MFIDFFPHHKTEWKFIKNGGGKESVKFIHGVV